MCGGSRRFSRPAKPDSRSLARKARMRSAAGASKPASTQIRFVKAILLPSVRVCFRLGQAQILGQVVAVVRRY